MRKTVLVFGAGIFVGIIATLVELSEERLIVINNMDGSVTMRYPGIIAKKNVIPPKSDEDL
jgi:hypothetical protein